MRRTNTEASALEDTDAPPQNYRITFVSLYGMHEIFLLSQLVLCWAISSMRKEGHITVRIEQECIV
jgi:hypothetical protein